MLRAKYRYSILSHEIISNLKAVFDASMREFATTCLTRLHVDGDGSNFKG